jgi:thiol oxidase
VLPGSLGPLGGATSIATGNLSSLSEEALAEAQFLGPQELGRCLVASGQRGSLVGELGKSNSEVGCQAVGSQGSEPTDCPASTFGERAGSASGKLPRLSAQPPTPSQEACVTQENLSRSFVAGNTEVPQAPDLHLGSWAGMVLEGASGSLGRPWEGLQCFQGSECWQGLGYLLDRRAAAPSPPWPIAPTAPPPGPVPLVAHGQAGSPGYAGEEGEGGLSCWAGDQPRPQDSLGTEQLLGTDSALGPVSGLCAELQDTEWDEVVDLVSTQLSRRILCDSLAALSGLAPQGSP